ncbi:MAG TPA: DUF1080 domain-containing protein [Opitutaceae bacterium]|jgi:hypothetical protein|nr:DUF1080 domain-containing protein [Opitutaceae bacterium]
MKTNRICFIASSFLAAVLLAGATSLRAASKGENRKVEKPINFVRITPDPIVGDWEGTGGVVAQVFKTSKGEYQANLLPAFDTANAVAVLQGTATADGITFSGQGWTGGIKDSHFIGGNGSKEFDLHHIVRVSPTEGAKPPADAVVLFDGSNLDAWAKKSGQDWLKEDGPAKWKLVDGAVECVPGTDCILTHQKFGDCHLHVEFRTVCAPAKSAVFLETRYEVNVKQDYGELKGTMTGGRDNTSKVADATVRPVFPPLSWQTFDIDFTAPRFNAAGKTAKATITVFLNGVKICDHEPLGEPFGSANKLGEAPTGPLMLQDHTTPIQYRNIWLVEKKS